MDLFAELVTYIDQVPDVEAVHVDLEHGVRLQQLPCVALYSAGPAARHPAAQGLGADTVSIDVELFISPFMHHDGSGHQLAQQIRSHLARFRSGMARAVDVSRPARRPDRNPDVRRLGMTVDIIVPAFSRKAFP